MNFSAPNGENVHYNVLRESLYNAVITAPSQVGDSVEIIVRTAMHSEWKADQISLIAIVQDEESKEILQANKSVDVEVEEDKTSSVSLLDRLDYLSIYPNPSKGKYTISSSRVNSGKITVISSTGSLIFEKPFKGEAIIDLSNVKTGLYFLILIDEDGSITKKLLKQ